MGVVCHASQIVRLRDAPGDGFPEAGRDWLAATVTEGVLDQEVVQQVPVSLTDRLASADGDQRTYAMDFLSRNREGCAQPAGGSRPLLGCDPDAACSSRAAESGAS
jgi:hypothetical protein